MIVFWEVFLFIVLLAISAFFSGAEAAFFSLKKSDLGDSREHQRIARLLNRPRRLLITILTGNTVVNTSMAFFAALITADVARKAGANVPLLLAIETIVLTVVIVLVSEITPKILAIKRSDQFAGQIARPIRLILFVLYPVAAVFYNLTHVITLWLPGKREALFDSEAELRALADLGADRGTLDQQESEMIKSVFDYGETSVREIMVPRIDIVAIEKGRSPEDALQMIRNSRFSKFPVYDKTIDHIEGILYAKDMLAYLGGKRNSRDIASISREPFFVPESKQIDDLLKDFQRRREAIAIVVDEYGGTAGLVTVEDVVEEVVGEIRDEFDREVPLIVSTKKRQWLVNAKITINDLTDRIPIHFPEDREYDTLGGFLMERFRDIPAAGSWTDYDNYHLEIRTLSGNRIVKVLISQTEENNESRQTL